MPQSTATRKLLDFSATLNWVTLPTSFDGKFKTITYCFRNRSNDYMAEKVMRWGLGACVKYVSCFEWGGDTFHRVVFCVPPDFDIDAQIERTQGR